MNKPKKSLGQNFLTSQSYCRRIIESVARSQPTSLLEIGPGRGALTSSLFDLAKNFIIVEKDDKLIQLHQDNFAEKENVQIFHQDFLKLNLEKEFSAYQPLCVVGNLPYNIASQIFIYLLNHNYLFSHLYLMFQKEVALRMVAKPKTKAFGLLSLWAQIYAQPKILFHIPAAAFFPKPKVQSSFIHLVLREKPLLKKQNEQHFWNFARLLFQSRRKMIRTTLKAKNIIQDAEFLKQPLLQQRPEALSIEELIELHEKILFFRD